MRDRDASVASALIGHEIALCVENWVWFSSFSYEARTLLIGIGVAT
jgi:hypothetical protein